MFDCLNGHTPLNMGAPITVYKFTHLKKDVALYATREGPMEPYYIDAINYGP